eukprot:GFUD01004077.1.p1 GENE.GFUD01004077.1~~GFUD01004077.1.p1  ORF type:complete len:198 (-),score=61.07 GFUD01004077.1:105-698(-)
MAESGVFMKQNEIFLNLASQFGFGPTEEEVPEKPDASGDSFGEILLKITTLQEEISRLKLKEQQAELSKRYAGLTQPSSMSWLLSDLSNLSAHLTYITNNSASLQHKLTNPVISNSLPLNSSMHTPLINITNLLAEISTSCDTAAAASEWVSNQNWSEVKDKLDLGQQHTEKLAARLRSAAFKIQNFRENLEKLTGS